MVDTIKDKLIESLMISLTKKENTTTIIKILSEAENLLIKYISGRKKSIKSTHSKISFLVIFKFINLRQT